MSLADVGFLCDKAAVLREKDNITRSAFGRPRRRGENTDLHYEQVCQAVDWIHLAQDTIQRRVFVKTTMTVLVLQKVGNILAN